MARQILDLLVGYKLSPILWKNIAKNSKNGLSAGRCQTPALRLIYDNYKEIKSSPGVKCYNTTGVFTSKNIQFSLNLENDMILDIGGNDGSQLLQYRKLGFKNLIN